MTDYDDLPIGALHEPDTRVVRSDAQVARMLPETREAYEQRLAKQLRGRATPRNSAARSTVIDALIRLMDSEEA